MCKCGSERVASISAKCSDMFFMESRGKEYNGYVPGGMNIGEGDYVEFAFCLDCGLIQGSFPVQPVVEFNEENENIFDEEGSVK